MRPTPRHLRAFRRLAACQPRPMAALSTALALIASTLVLAAAAFTPTATAAGRHDPLSVEEWQQACNHALGSMRSEADVELDCLPRRVIRRAARRNHELLLIERREPPKDMPAARYADTYFYDYRRDVLHHYVIDIANRTVMSHARVKDTQLPLTDSEIANARDLVAQDRRVAAAMASEYLDITGELMSSLDQVEIKAFAFHSSTLGEDVIPRLRRCGRHRCAQLAVSVRGIAFEVQPIVDISKGRVFDLSRSRPAARRAAGHGHGTER